MDLKDLSNARADQARDCEIVHPVTGEDTGIVIEVVGRDSERYREFERKATNRRIEKASKKRGAFSMDREELEEDGKWLLARCTVGWRGLEYKGSELDFSEENAYWLYDNYSWIREQVDAFIGDRTNFLSSSESGS